MCQVKVPSGTAFMNARRLEDFGGYRKAQELFHLVIARGSAWETRGRYERMSICIEAGVITSRTALCSEIIAILTTTIRTLRNTR